VVAGTSIPASARNNYNDISNDVSIDAFDARGIIPMGVFVLETANEPCGKPTRIRTTGFH